MTVLAHGVGSAQDLPLPLDLVLQAGAAAVLVSFLAVAVRRRPVSAPSAVPRPEAVAPAAGLPPALRTGLRAALLLLAAAVVVVAFAGPPAPRNPAPYALYAGLWVGLVPLSLLLGPVWRELNPLRTLHALLVRLGLPAAGLRPGGGEDVTPATAALLAFVWLELVAPHRDEPAVVGAFLVLYAAVQLAGAAVRGPGWFARGDAFEVYATLVGRLCPFGRRDGRIAWRPRPLVAPPGTAGFVAVWWGSTVVDSTSSSTVWAAVSQAVLAWTGAPAPLGAVVLDTVLLVAVCGAVAGSIALVARAADVAPALVPVAVGYTVAHYCSLLVVEGQRGVLLAFGATAEPWRPAPVAVAAVQVAAVLAGHVAGVVAAHDRTPVGASGAPAAVRIADELPLVLLMVGYTLVGLTLLFAA